jgi:hypothetical protein
MPLDSHYSLDFVLLMRVQSESILLLLKCDGLRLAKGDRNFVKSIGYHTRYLMG